MSEESDPIVTAGSGENHDGADAGPAGDDLVFTRSEWRYAVNNDDTSLDYEAWVAAQKARAGRSEAPPEVREKIAEAFRNGNVTISPEGAEALARLDLRNPNYTLTEVKFTFWGPNDVNDGGLGVDWSTTSAGFGRCDFYLDKDGQLRCMNEAMGKAFLRSLLERMLEQTVLDD